MTTKTKKFDAVAESRKWKEAVGRELNAMTMEERLAHFRKVREEYILERKAWERKNTAPVGH